jgi:DNA primase catalytic core
MFISNLDDVRPLLRSKLREYLHLKLGIDKDAKKILCFAHEDSNPSMHFNHKVNDEVVVCFACGVKADIFKAASIIEGLPERGIEWVTETIPHLAKLLNIPISVGTPTLKDKERLEAFRLAQDVSDILSMHPAVESYMNDRKWYPEEIIAGTISEEDLISELGEKGWKAIDLFTSGMVSKAFFGEDKITFVINDYRGRPVGFLSRNLVKMPKYINTAETVIYEKRKVLMGLDIAVKNNAKQNGIYLVEGPGDLLQLHRLGIYNVAAICGTALTKNHLELLKMLNITNITLALDWDDAGVIATQRILKDEINGISGINVSVLNPPEGGFKDLDSYLVDKDDAKYFFELKVINSFEWLISKLSKNKDITEACSELIPSIAIQQSAVKREILAKALSIHTSLSLQSILQDVESIRAGHAEEKQKRVKESVDRYVRDVRLDPDNIVSIKAQHEEELELISKDYFKDAIGVNYQLNRFDAMQAKHKQRIDGNRTSGFVFRHFRIFGRAFSDGMDMSSGVLMYLGGRANSGKTATGVAICLDVAISDPDTIVCMHYTDDGYNQIEPRIKSTIAQMAGLGVFPLGVFANPKEHCKTQKDWDAFFAATAIFRELLATEKLVIIDSEDGKSLSTIESNLRFIRSRHPDKKLLVFMDSTYNYNSFEHLPQTERITRIADAQKNFTNKYDCCVIATAEYRKNASNDVTKIRLPVDDDLADARAIQYRANIIIHVYNDVHDRREHAEIFHGNEADKQPRLFLIVSKNKLGNFKQELTLDLDKNSVTLKEIPPSIAKQEWQAFISEPEDDKEHTYEVDSDY